MIDSTTLDQIIAIHHAARPTVIEYAGAGSQALWWLHSVAGSSRTILEATNRYSRASMENLLGQQPAQFVSQATAVAMAHAGYRRAMDLSNNATVVALACTATIATDRVKFGDHGCWVTTRDQHHIISYGLTLSKGARDRSGEEAVISTLLIQALAYAVGVIPAVTLNLRPDERFEIITTPCHDVLSDLLHGGTAIVEYQSASNDFLSKNINNATILSGSFNPIHTGHRELLTTAMRMSGQVGYCELSVINADKPPLKYSVIAQRASLFTTAPSLILTRAPRFIDKAALMPGSTFVLGYDTVVRLLNPKYYPDGDVSGCLAQIAQHDCRFIVAGRITDDGVFHSFDAQIVPSAWRHLFTAIDEQTFRNDVSSTAIRNM
jgi:hypothetical protein